MLKTVITSIALGMFVFFTTCSIPLSAQEAGKGGTKPSPTQDELCDHQVPDFSAQGYKMPPLPANPIPTYAVRLGAAIYLFIMLIAGSIVFHLKLSRWILTSFMGLSMVTLGFIMHGCVCSVGSFGNIFIALFHSDNYTIGILTVIVFFLPLLFALIAGRIFCGSVCPLGAVQELSLFISRKVPRKLDMVLQAIKYIVLIAVIFYAIKSMFLPVCKYDPYVTLFRLNGSTEAWVYTILFIILGIVIARPFCRYLCPYSILLGLLSLISVKKRIIDQDTCVSCGQCEKVCPINAIKGKSLSVYQCVTCGQCNKICPTKAIK